MSAEKAFVILAALLAVAYTVNGWGVSNVSPKFGRCPKPVGMSNFSTFMFEGEWKVRYLFTWRKYTECTTLTFTPTSATTMDITSEERVSGRLNVEADGQSISPMPSNPASMLWTWNYFPSQTEYVTVIDTDYDRYAILFMCQDFYLFHQPIAFILSKHEYLPSVYVTRAQNLVQSFHPVNIYWEPPKCYYVYSSTNKTETKTFHIDKTLDKLMKLFKPLIPY